jgi:hypothetical protein
MGKNKKNFQKPATYNPSGGQGQRPISPPPAVPPLVPPQTTPPTAAEENTPPTESGFADRLLNRTDGIVGSMIFPVGFAAFLLVGVLLKGVKADEELKPFVWLENFVLAFMAGVSTHNYQTTAAKLRDLPVSSVVFRLNLLMLVNAIWFTLTVFFTDPTPRLSFIVAIYATFTAANIIQVTKSSVVKACKARSNAILEASAFLREENGPTMIAYTFMVVAVMLYSKFRAAQHQYLEAFAGGVAAFHLGLSIVRYFRAIGKDDPITSVLNTVEWTGQAVSALNTIPSKSITWKRWVGGCSLITFVILIFHFDPYFSDQVRSVIDHIRGTHG